MDEKPFQLLGLARPSLPMKAGTPEREDFEYIRLGTCSIFVFTEPLGGWRYASELTFRSISPKDIKRLGVLHTMAA